MNKPFFYYIKYINDLFTEVKVSLAPNFVQKPNCKREAHVCLKLAPLRQVRFEAHYLLRFVFSEPSIEKSYNLLTDFLASIPQRKKLIYTKKKIHKRKCWDLD
jgi:hypothetical protein